MNELNANTSRRRRRSFGARSGLAAALAAVLLLGLTACGKSQSPAASQPGSAAVSSALPAEQPAAPAASSQASPAPEETPDGSGSSDSSSAEKPTDENSNGADEPWKAEFEKSLLENYGVTPDHYEDLGGGVYQVYVEIDGRIVPYVAVDSATGDYHG